MIYTIKGFGRVNKADVFLESSCFLNDPTDVGNLTSGSSAFSKSRLNIWKFLVHVLLKPHLENFQHYFAIVWDENLIRWVFQTHDSTWTDTQIFLNIFLMGEQMVFLLLLLLVCFKLKKKQVKRTECKSHCFQILESSGPDNKPNWDYHDNEEEADPL